MKWTPQQDRAMRAVSAWLRDPDGPQVFRLFGYAGTGKTTMAKILSEDVDGTVLFAAYTGKAALVLRQKGCPATTIHALIYKGADRSKKELTALRQQLAELLAELRQEAGEEVLLDDHPRVERLKARIAEEERTASSPMFLLNPESELKHAALLVVDECSMVDEQTGADVLSFGKKVLVLGDPAQLPPVFGGGFFTDHAPDVMLTDVQRQAKDNPIIALATMIREGSMPAVGSYGSSRVLASVDPEAAMQADQILVGKNATRFATNRRVRSLLGRPGWGPKEGDRLVCLRNNHDLGLLNGALWTADRDGEKIDSDIILRISSPECPSGLDVLVHDAPFRGEEVPFWAKKSAEEFDFGYALTVHKSQGSQWNDVMLFDESYVFRADRWKWLYTGVTRAAERLTMVKT